MGNHNALACAAAACGLAALAIAGAAYSLSARPELAPLRITTDGPFRVDPLESRTMSSPSYVTATKPPAVGVELHPPEAWTCTPIPGGSCYEPSTPAGGWARIVYADDESGEPIYGSWYWVPPYGEVKDLAASVSIQVS